MTKNEAMLRVGDCVTRNGDDVHRIVRIDEDFPDYADLVCLAAGESGAFEVGESEFNCLERYDPLSAEQAKAMIEAQANGKATDAKA